MPSSRNGHSKHSFSRHQVSPNFGPHARAEVERDVAQQFIKKFRFVPLEKDMPALPELDSVYTNPAYSVQSLQEVKKDLNAVKSRLNDFEISDWHQHTRRRSSLLPILRELRRRIGGEFVTQAFAKLYECVAEYKLVPDGKQEFVSVHLCEAPGAFITGLNHYLKLNHQEVKWHWFANTLNPYYEGNCLGNMIADDRFIFHTLDSWCFGEDYTGDIMQRHNLDAIVRRSKEFDQVNLVTADGSIDCLDVPEFQEEHVSRLHLAEAVTALKVLTEGGSVILKMFTLFEHCSVNLLYLLYVSFAELNVFKPCTSKPGNSEVYVIGKGFRRPTNLDEYLNKIFDNLHSDKAMFDVKQIPTGFIDQVRECAYTFMLFQQDVIEHNIHFYQREDTFEDKRVAWSNEKLCEKFFETYKIGRIRPTDAILYGVDVANGMININPRDNSGTYNERTMMNSLSGEQRLQMLKDKLNDLIRAKTSVMPRSRFCDRPLKEVKSCIETINFSTGKPIQKLLSSKFVVITLVRFLTEVIEFTTEEVHPQKELDTLFTLDRSTYTITIDMRAYAALTGFDSYEKELFRHILNCVTELPLEESVDYLIIENWLLLTQFSVGLVFFLKNFVFDCVESIPPNKIKFSRLMVDGIANLQYLNEALQSELNHCAPLKTVLGLVPIQLLFDGGFYYAVINYNNSLCLEYCSRLLGK
ncbi:cap-specific mRNA (nucleoside-2'-O-)-methyltransferase 2 [Topomyia yanbarensis]|uniref:cap-specific mRNA (nucleoside-2'-O-)-methyltransferase 2 n=1 Tax=Topomyia yanbarensis TaxID=2498891 RepID=UPI00273C2BB5|nr:cap-specific mRNA (nucleoside-2'-O-)-methyltransferase 2 [Topomyia yanbarensis]